MRNGVKVAGFALGLAVLFGAAYLTGGAFGTQAIGRSGHGGLERPAEGQPPGAMSDMAGMPGMAGAAPDQHAAGHSHADRSHEGGGPGGVGGEHAAGGLAVTDQGYRLHRVSPDPVVGRPAELAFQVIGPGGRPVTSYVNTHDKPLHLILVRRDLTGFQHLHPTLGPDGTWRVPLTVAGAGDYRAIADFVPDGRTDTLVLGTDLMVAGDYRPAPLPPPSTVALADGYTVTMVDDPTIGSLRFTISRAGVPVTDLAPYLAAYGHLVALRQDDLGYLHVHPDGGPGVSAPGPEVSFAADLSPGSVYRLYLQFAHAGGVHTAEFTVDAGGGT